MFNMKEMQNWLKLEDVGWGDQKKKSSLRKFKNAKLNKFIFNSCISD